MNHEHQFRRGVRWSLIGSLGAAAFQFLQMIVFARLAGPEQAGEYALAATVMALLLPLAEAGLSQALVQSRALTPGHFVALFWLNFGISILVFTCLWVFGPWLAAWYERPVLCALLPFMGLVLLVAPFGTQYGALLLRDLRFETAAKIEILAGAASFTAVTLLAWRGWGPWAMAAGFVVKNTLTSAGSLLAARRDFPVDWRKPSPWMEIRPYLGFAGYDLAARWTDFLANWLDKLIVGKWLGATALGFYHLAFTLGTIPTARLGHAVTRVTFPLFAKAQGDSAQLEAIFRRAGRDVVLALFPVYTLLALFSRELTGLLYGPQWAPAAPLLVAFGVAGLVRTLAAVFPQLTRGIGQPRLLFLWLLGWTAASNTALCLFLWLEPTAGAAAWSRVTAKFLLEIPLLTWLARRCGVAFLPLLSFAGKVALALAPIAAATWLAGACVQGFWEKLLLKTVVFLAGLVWLGWKSPLREALQTLVAGLRKAA